MTDPILIVGAGPTGLTAALELSRFGLPVRLIDKLPRPAATSRAIGIQARTLELIRQRGLAEELLSLGNPASGTSIYGDGKQITRIDFSHVDSRYNYVLFLSQAETERILQQAIARRGVAIERGTELVALSQNPLSHDASPVSAVLRHPDGRLEQVRAPWLISAEGAHSTVRTTLDLRFEGKTLDQAYALGDLHLSGDLPATDLHIFSSEHGLLGLFPMGARHFRLIASNPFSRPETGTQPSLDELQRIYDQRSHIPARLHDMTWSSWFHINSRMVPRLKVGRLLLGGDAAHIHSPAGAQGMNTGIQDMINLGWKLALVIRGEAAPVLLDTYEQDRLPVMRDVLFKTEKLTSVIGSGNPLIRGLVNHLGPYVGASGLLQDNGSARVSQTALGYRDSPLSSNHAHRGTLHAGDRVPNIPVRHRTAQGWAESSLQALLDPSRFVLLRAQTEATVAADPALRDASAACGDRVALQELAPSADPAASRRYQAELGGHADAYLVRPDGYVGLAVGANAASRQLTAYRQRWLAPATAAPAAY